MRETKDIIAIDILRLRGMLAFAEHANRDGDLAVAKIFLQNVVGLGMNIVELIEKEEPKNVD